MTKEEKREENIIKNIIRKIVMPYLNKINNM